MKKRQAKKKKVELDLTLRPYQGEGVRHLFRQPFGGLLMDPGTGKTVTLLSAFHGLRQKKLIDKLFIVAPLRVAYEVWPAEIEKWKFPYTYKILHGDNKDRLLDQADDGDTDIWIINYSGLEWLFNRVPWKYWKKQRWWWVCDESTKIKRTSTALFKTMDDYIQYFARRTILTGTPAPNGLEDLFGQVKFCDMGKRLGRFITQYRRRYFYPMGYEWALQPDAEELIWKQLDGLFYRVSDDVLGLPPLHRVPIAVRLPESAKKVYEQLEDEFLVQLSDGLVTAVNAGVKSHKLRQVANGMLYDNDKKSHIIHDAKIDALADLVDELGGSPLLVGFEFTHDGERIAKKFKAPMINGATKPAEFKELLKKFNQGMLPVLALQVSLGYGLNLQEMCNHVAMYGQIWDLEVYEQFYKRVRRSGQKKTVFLHEFICKGTVDSQVHRCVITGKGSKKARQDRLLKSIVERYYE